MRELDFSDGFGSESAPSQGSLQSNSLKTFASDAAFEADKGSPGAAGDQYWNTTSVVTRVHNGTIWTDLASGGGGGGSPAGSSGINYILHPDGESLANWNLYGDAAGETPVDGTGGVANVTWTQEAVAPLRGDNSFLLTKDAANRQGEGVSYDIAIDEADKNKSLTISFDYEGSAAFVGGDNSDVRVFIYDVDAAMLVTPVNKSLLTAPSGRVSTRFDTMTSTNYRLVFHVATVNANAYTLKIDNVSVGPVDSVTTVPVTDWVDYTPGGSWNAFGNYKGRYRRVGDTMEVLASIELTGVPSGNFTLDLPSGHSIDTAKLTEASTSVIDNAIHGIGQATQPGIFHIGIVQYVNPTQIRITGDDGVSLWSPTNPFSFVANNSIVTRFSVPIVGWSSNVVLANALTFKVSSMIASGTRVTATPAALGEYRSYIKSASSIAGIDDAPAAAPSNSNGMLIYSDKNYATIGTAGETGRWEIYVGKNKKVSWEFYSAAARTGLADPAYNQNSSANTVHGLNYGYDPVTGIAAIDGFNQLTTTATRFAGKSMPTAGAGLADAGSLYFDINVSEVPVPISSNHGDTHENAGSDPLNGDRLNLDYIPSNYTRDITGTDALSNNELAAHAKGMNDALDSLSNFSATATGNTNTTSATLVTVSGMSVTPTKAGSYLAMFSSTFYHGTNNSDIDFDLALNGSTISSSLRYFSYTGANNIRRPVYTQAVVTVNGTTDIVTARYQTSSGTLNAEDRSLILIRLGS